MKKFSILYINRENMLFFDHDFTAFNWVHARFIQAWLFLTKKIHGELLETVDEIELHDN
jgi:hypothetical protein